jgi:hypothetical protein
MRSSCLARRRVLNRGGRGADRNGTLSCSLTGVGGLGSDTGRWGRGNDHMRALAESRTRSSQHVPLRKLGRRARRVLLGLMLLPSLLVGLPALGAGDSDEYDPEESGHPLRVAAYLLHPFGVLLDTLIFRPAYWLGTKEPIKTLVGNTD